MMRIVIVLAVVLGARAARTQGISARIPSLNDLAPAKVAPLPAATALDATDDATCAVAGGEVWCWGNCARGLCSGKQGPEAQAKPQKVPGLKNVTRVSVGGGFACALLDDGGVSCWGRTPGSKAPHRPERVKGLPRSIQISAGHASACAIGDDGEVRCWGSNDNGELGQGSRLGPRASGEIDPVKMLLGDRPEAFVRIGIASSETPLVVPGASGAIAIAVGRTHACAVRRGGKVVCWGAALRDRGRQLNDGKWTDDKLIRDGALHAIDLPGPAGSVNADDRRSCAVLEDGRSSCWSYAWASTPLKGPDECFTKIAMQPIDPHAWYMIAANGDLHRVVGYCWANKEPGVPAVVESSRKCARTQSGEIWCWGTNEHAQLGRPATPIYKE